MPREILIVDDEPSIVVPIQFLMEQQGYNVLVAENGEYALDIIFKYKPDLILLGQLGSSINELLPKYLSTLLA
jgi:DNA-binding response OmpR family regulator